MDLFSYMDYRAYLKDRFAFEKQNNKNYSYRFFARIAGLSSPGFLKMVMDGSRNLTPTSINQFVKAFKMSKKEAAYFEALVLFNQAKKDKDRDLYFERLTALKPAQKIQGLVKDQYEYFTKKYFVVIREMVALPHFKNDPAWIAQRLNANVKAKDVEHAIEVLLRIGLLSKDKSGKLVQSETSLSTPAEVHSIEVYNYHRDMLNEAKEALLEVHSDLRDITSLTLPLPLKSLKEIKQKIHQFREDIIDYANKGSQEFDDVYQLNLQLFPVTKTKGDST